MFSLGPWIMYEQSLEQPYAGFKILHMVYYYT